MTDSRDLRRTRFSAWIARSGAGGLLYGAVVTAAVLVAAGGHDSSTRRVVATWAFVLGTYWLTHVYVHAAAAQFHGDDRNLLRRTLTSGRGESSVLLGGVPAMVVFVIAATAADGTLAAERIALYATVVLLAGVGFLGGRAAGRTVPASLGEAFGAGMLGVIMVAAKTLLH
ncbi:hypothetical protein [Nocardioides sambongensis]|uniref:hypothetical protein n=1 Tax=Nocardioides sambongensis TaxID=2589074 RepID=UPI001128BBE2|nr:hypothetical protein [Nocardioides sambongensis]